MGIKVKQLPPLEATQAETVWPGDDCFDPEGSDLERFLISLGSDVAALKLREADRPARIVYRSLRQLEVDAMTARGPEMIPYEAFRYGIVSIDGVDLDRQLQINGLTGVSQGCLEELCDGVYMDMPIRYAIDAMNRITNPGKSQRREVRPVRVSLPMMLGIFIQAVTFRTR